MNSPLDHSAPDIGDRLVQFEADWSSGQVPDVARYFRDASDDDRHLIEDLIEIDLECRWKQFDAESDPSAKDRHGFPLFPLVDDYASLLQESLQQLIFTPQCVAEEYRVRSRWGDKPSKESFLERFPSHRTEIEDALHQIDTDFKNEGIQVSEESSLSNATAVQPTVILEQSTRKDSTLAPEEKLTGTKIGKYRLESRLGHGAFGEVWKAHDPDLIRDVAIKFPRLDKRFPPALLEIFRTEAQKLALLSRKRIPGIVNVFECGEHDGKPYFVSDFIEGGSLAERMQREKFSHEESAQLVAKLAKTLQKAHEQDVVHRDIKPGNILLDAKNEPYLADFGLAISEEEQDREPESIVGTYAYMAPEQAKAESHTVDGRADIYSLGVILYRLLTGKLPYTAETGEAYINKILNHKIRPLRQRDETIPKELERICLKCLKKDEDERYSSAGELTKDLRASEKKSRDHKRILVSIVLLLIIVPLSVIAWKSLGSSSSKDIETPVVKTGITPVVRLPRRWYNLLEVAPEVDYFPQKEAASTWNYNENEQYLTLNSKQYGVFLYDSTDSDFYRLQVSISRNGLNQGFSGLVVGFQIEVETEAEMQATFQSVGLKCVDGKQFLIQRSAIQMKRKTGADPSFQVLAFDSEEIDPLDFREGVLEIRIQAGVISEIRWNDKPLDRLTSNEIPVWLPFPLNTQGRIGIISGYEDATFRNFRFMTED